MRSYRVLQVALLSALLLAVGCNTADKPTPVSKQPSAQPAQVPSHPELKQPFEQALKALGAMGEKGEQKDYKAAQEQFQAFRTELKVIQPLLVKVDPRLANHIADGATELDLEFKKPEAQIRPWEFREEAGKLGRLLAQGAGLLGAPIDTKLLPPDPATNVPFNAEQRVTITLTEHQIQPSRLELGQHTRVTFVITNRGADVHEFALAHFGVEVEDIKPGQTKELTLVLVDSGDWEMACHLPGHYEVGMLGTVKVTPAVLQSKP